MDIRNKSGEKQAVSDLALPFHGILHVLLAMDRLPTSLARVNVKSADPRYAHRCKAQAAVKP